MSRACAVQERGRFNVSPVCRALLGSALVAISLTPAASGAVKRTKRHAAPAIVRNTGRIPIATADIQPSSEGVPMPIGESMVLTTSEIMERARMEPTRPEMDGETIELPYPDRSPLPQNPDSPDDPGTGVGASPARPGSLPESTPFTAQTTGVNFMGPTLVFTTPPDSMGAVGPTQFIAITNNRIISYNKSTGAADGVLDLPPDSFFSSVRASARTCDPRVRYDRLSGRWFVVMINVALPNRVLLAWSDASSAGTITAGTLWSFTYFVNGACATCLADYPTLGIDAKALYIGTNNFTSSDGGVTYSGVGSDGYVLPKAPLLAGAGTYSRFAVVTSASGSGPFTPQGVDNYEPSSNEGYFIGIDNASKGTLVLRRVFNPGTSPTMSSNIFITVSTTSTPKTVPHLGNTGGTNGNLSPVDDRLFAAHIRNGHLWTAHNITVTTTGVSTASTTASGRVGVRWYEFTGIRSSDNGGTPAFVQFGTFYDSTSTVTQARFFWFPSVVVTGQGHAAMGFSTAGNSFAADAGFVGRWSSDPTGSMQAYGVYTSSASAYNPSVSFDPGGAGGRRWGDYSLTSVDPLDDMTAWTIQEYCNATNSYAARIVKLLAPGPATLASASPASIASGQTAVSVTITGTASSGRGFFDPGANLAPPALPFAHISAQVTGGVVVNSVTYNSPTSVTLSLKTTGVSTGPVTVTITNPDGQSTSSGSILSVTNSGNPAITCPATVSVNTPLVTSSCGTNVTFSGSTAATATGSPTPTISYSPVSGSFFSVGTTSVIATATNSNGSASCSFNVVVTDKTGPVISCPANKTVTTSGTSAIVTFSVTATDNCGAVSVVSNPPSGSSFPLGTTTVVSTATDSAGNTANCSFTVTVTNPSVAAKLWLVTPCRLIDTRNPSGPLGGPSLTAVAVRNVTVSGNCGVPSGALALVLNVTAVAPASAGWLTLYPGPSGAAQPFVSTLNYRGGKTLANNAVVPIGSDGTINVYNSGPSGTNFIVDVAGYFK
jgi:hypothetical protein